MAVVKTKQLLSTLIVVIFYFIFSFGRIIHSYTKLASDPSYDFVEEINRLGLRSFISGSEGYLQIAPRMLAFVAHFFPVKNQAVILSILATFTFVSCALLINQAIRLQTGSAVTGFISGAVLLLVPAASESTVGNHGSVKWSIVTALCVILCSPNFMSAFPRTTLAFSALSALCSPLTILAAVPIFYIIAKLRMKSPRHTLQVAFTLIVLTGIQFLYWLFSGKAAQIYGGDIRYKPWAGMGQFWWSLILTPPIFIGGTLIVLLVVKFIRKSTPIGNILVLAISTILIIGSSFLTTGIKDSTAVAWQSLSWILVILTLQQILPIIKPKFTGYLTIGLCAAFFIRSVEKWYSASWYLSDGKDWSVLINEAESRCKSEASESQLVELLLSTVELPCESL